MPQAVPQRSRGMMGPPPTVPAGIPVRSGAAAATKQPLLSPLAKQGQPTQQQRSSMHPPRLSLSNVSSTSSRPSLTHSDASSDGRTHRYSYDERSKTPLRDSFRVNNLPQDIDMQFDDLLLEVPSSVRLKFATVTKDVKRSILDSSMSSNPALLSSLGLPVPPTSDRKAKGKMSTPKLRKAKSSTSVNADVAARPQPGMLNVGKDLYQIVPPVHSRGYSIDASPRPGFSSSSRPSTPTRPSSVFMPQSPAQRGGQVGPYEGPETYVKWLESFKATDLAMDVGKAKKLRMLLRHETTGWVAAFLDIGGYARILDRVQDLLDIEWREEQHDDKMLYELLRCVKALSTSEVGKAALRAAHPRPFPGLSKLLFSEKKPGDLACRQIIVELWLFYFELFPEVQSPNPRDGAVRFESPRSPPVDAALFVRSLLLPEQESKTKDYHEFITTAHRPRIFKAWVQEMSDICRDYFWIMCHGSNTLWLVNEVDEKLVERPVAPGGATGGVEFEAMGYVTTHFRLLNTLATKLQETHPEEGRKLHEDLLLSGLDRILVTLRKASTTYYPTLHLELARYVEVLRRSKADGKLPYLIGKLVGPPPEELRRHRSASEWLPRTKFDAF